MAPRAFSDADLEALRRWPPEVAPSSSPDAIKAEVAKLGYLRERGADRIDVSAVPPERIRQLAGVGRRSTPKALRAMAPERRHPILLATLAGAYASITDEVVQMFDQALAATSSRARSLLLERQLAAAEANVGRLELLDEILDVALDTALDDAGVGAGVRGLGQEGLASAVRSEDERLPRDGGHLAIIEARYSHIRSFAPQALSALSLRASAPSEAFEAAHLLKTMNAEGRRHVPTDAPRALSQPAGSPTWPPPGPPATRAPTATTGSCAPSTPSRGRCARGRSGSRVPAATATSPPT